MKDTILLFADGASKGNPGKGGWGALILYDGQVVELGGAEAHTTNNRMELMAAIKSLERLRAMYAESGASSTQTPIIFHTDSSYVINGITKWVAGWKLRSWLTKEKKAVLNRDLWEQLSEAVDALKPKGAVVSWQHVGGHVGVAGNERVDDIASGFAEGKPPDLFVGKRSTYTHDIENISHNVEKAKERSASKSRSRQKAYSYVSMVEGKVLVHTSWAECEARVKGKMARFKKATSPTEEAAIITEFS